MKLKLIAAAVLVMAGVSAQADTTSTDWGQHASFEIGGGFKSAGSFIDYYLFSINPAASVTSSAVVLNNQSVFNITGATYSLWSGDGAGAGVDTLVATFALDGTTGNTFNSQALAVGNYFYKVTGNVTGAFGGLYSLTSTLVTAPVPEPETYALMLAGLGAVAFVARRRKSA